MFKKIIIFLFIINLTNCLLLFFDEKIINDSINGKYFLVYVIYSFGIVNLSFLLSSFILCFIKKTNSQYFFLFIIFFCFLFNIVHEWNFKILIYHTISIITLIILDLFMSRKPDSADL